MSFCSHAPLKIVMLSVAAGCLSLCLAACGESVKEKAKSSSVTQVVEDGVDLTITHKTQINAFLKAKKKLRTIDAKRREMMKQTDM